MVLPRWSSESKIVTRSAVRPYRIAKTLVGPLAWERGRKGNNGPSIKNAVVGEEKMRSGHQLGLVPFVPFSVLTLMVGWQEGNLVYIWNRVLLIPKGFLCNSLQQVKKGSRGNWIMMAWLSVWSEVQMICIYGSTDATATPLSLASLKSRMV